MKDKIFCEYSNNQCIMHSEVCRELTDLYKRKNHDYGDSFHKSYEKYGLVMVAIRLGDKFNRFEKLLDAERKVEDESIRDTLLDLANYAIMSIMEIDSEMKKEIKKNGEE